MCGYLRVSLTDQAERGVSLPAQRERVQAWATAQGLDLVAVEEDRGASGGLAPHRRPGLTRALERVRSGEADGIVVVKLDRLSRSVRDTLDLIERSDREGWRLASVSENLDTGTATGRFVVTLLAALGEMERAQIGERTSTAMDHIAREGRARSRFLPFGFRQGASEATEAVAGDRSALVEDDAEQAILRRMLALRDEGNGAQRIAKALGNEGTPNPRTGRAWSTGTVAAILRTADRRAAVLA